MNVRDVNETHDPQLRSWVESANVDGCDFPIQNLPFGIFRRRDSGEAFRGGIAIGDFVLDLAALDTIELFWGEPAQLLTLASRRALNEFMALGHEATHTLRGALSRALREGSPVQENLEPLLVPMADVEMALPARIGDYTDFYSSIHHATAVGKLFRPDEPLLPNYTWIPIGYHGRASSIVVSETTIAWPAGQRLPRGATQPVFGPSQRLDYELELGFFVGRPNALGRPIAIADAQEHLFGACLLNDWSARDIQGWEYQPLGPFLGKSFATTISPWIVTLEALAPFRTAWPVPTAPAVLPYLTEAEPASATFAITVYASIATRTMRECGVAAHAFDGSSYADAYWTPGQLVAHHTSNGCNFRSGDLLGTGTLSGPLPQQAGSLLERSNGGSVPVALVSGEERRFLSPSDEVILSAYCEREGYRRIGFGTAAGIVA